MIRMFVPRTALAFLMPSQPFVGDSEVYAQSPDPQYVKAVTTNRTWRQCF
jgi:hypothetical protein